MKLYLILSLLSFFVLKTHYASTVFDQIEEKPAKSLSSSGGTSPKESDNIESTESESSEIKEAGLKPPFSLPSSPLKENVNFDPSTSSRFESNSMSESPSHISGMSTASSAGFFDEEMKRLVITLSILVVFIIWIIAAAIYL
jgi:hypothetical protein